MDAPCFCPGCGLNFQADENIELDGYKFYYREQIVADGGLVVDLTVQQFLFLYTLAKAKGRWVAVEAIAGRISETAESPRVLVNTVACNVRRRLYPGRSPIVSTYRGKHGFSGYRWGTPGSPETEPHLGRTGENYLTAARSGRAIPARRLSLLRP
jgi:hypothetical protein